MSPCSRSHEFHLSCGINITSVLMLALVGAAAVVVVVILDQSELDQVVSGILFQLKSIQ